MSGTAARRAAKAEAAAPKPVATDGGLTAAPTRAARRALDPDVLVGLEEERDFLLRSLRDLEAEHEAGDVDEDDFLTLKDDYTARAASVLRAIAEREAGLAAVRAARPATPGRRIGTVAVVIGFAVVAGLLLANAAGRRGATDTATGDNRQSCRQGLLEAQANLGEAPATALKQYDEVLAQCPGNAEALTYKGWLLYRTSVDAAGSPDAARLQELGLQSLADAVLADPDFADARIFRASAFQALGRTAEAKAEIDRVDDSRVPPFMKPMVDGLRAKIAGAGTGTTVPGTTVGSSGQSSAGGS